MDEIYYKPPMNILLTIVTCGIWAAVWSYRTHDDLQKYNGDGIGGTVALVLALFVGFVIPFTVASETEKMYQREGWESPIKTLDGLWILLPIVGNFVWYFKAQNALNNFWLAKGSRPAMS
jgi:hypothetical protein